MQATSQVGTVRVSAAGLVPHPLYAELFDELPSRTLRELARQVEGAATPGPVELLPDRRTVLAGWEVVRAARDVLGRPEVDAVVRDDLASLGPAAVEARLIECALPFVPGEDRRAFARVWVRSRELGAGRRGAGLTRDGYLALREAVLAAAGTSDRSLDRHARLLGRTPPQVQQAVRSRRLPQNLAEALASAPPRVREQVAREIGAGVDPRSAVLARLPAANGVAAAARPADALKRLLRALPGLLEALEGRADSIRVGAEHAPSLGRFADLLKRLAGRAAAEAESDEETAGLLDEVMNGTHQEVADEEE